jgi:hypothetical protein
MRYGLFGKSIGIGRMVPAVEAAAPAVWVKSIVINKLYLADVLLQK